MTFFFREPSFPTIFTPSQRSSKAQGWEQAGPGMGTGDSVQRKWATLSRNLLAEHEAASK